VAPPPAVLGVAGVDDPVELLVVQREVDGADVLGELIDGAGVASSSSATVRISCRTCQPRPER